MTEVKGIKCPLCGYTVYSRARHDMRWCPCDTVAVDGGFDYMKVSATAEAMGLIETVRLQVDASRSELYHDWNHGKDLFGLVPPNPSRLSAASREKAKVEA